MRKSCQSKLDNYQNKFWKLCGVSSTRIEVWELDSPLIYTVPENAIIEMEARDSMIRCLQNALTEFPQHPLFRKSNAVEIYEETAKKLLKNSAEVSDTFKEFKALCRAKYFTF